LIMALLTSKLTRTYLYTPALRPKSQSRVTIVLKDKRVANVLYHSTRSLRLNEGQCRPRFSFFSIQMSKNRQSLNRQSNQNQSAISTAKTLRSTARSQIKCSILWSRSLKA